MNKISRRERKKQKTKTALQETAWELFQKKGYDETTIEDITEAIDVSRRTFFRYFDSKEAVLFGDWRENLEKLTKIYKDRPEDEHPLISLKEIMTAHMKNIEKDKKRYLFLKKLAANSEKVGEYENNVIHPAIKEFVAEKIAEKLNINPEEDMRPYIYAGLGMTAMEVSKKIWVEKDGNCSLEELIKKAYEIILSPKLL